MRVIHFATSAATIHVEPWCGAWGPMDTDWTDIVGDATCAGCRAVFNAAPAGRPIERAAGAEHQP